MAAERAAPAVWHMCIGEEDGVVPAEAVPHRELAEVGCTVDSGRSDLSSVCMELPAYEGSAAAIVQSEDLQR